MLAAPEDDHAKVFYRSSNNDYVGVWHDGSSGFKVGERVPPISEVLGARATIRKPVRPLMTTAKCVLADQMEATRKARETGKVLSADVVPKKYPAAAETFRYPEMRKIGAENPLYETTSQMTGKELPMEHHLPDRYFPSTSHFTGGFVDRKPRFTGLNTKPTPSKIHACFDEFF